MAVMVYTTKKGRRYKVELWHAGQRLIAKRGFETKKDALRWQLEAEKRLDKQLKSPTDMAFSLIATKYLDDMKARRQRNTYVYKRSTINRFLAFIGGDFLVTDITLEQIKDFHMEQYTERGAKAANRDIKELTFLMNWAIRNDLHHKNPFRRVEPYPEESYTRHVPTIDDINKARAAATPEELDWLDTLYYTGARLGEVVRLRWEDVDFDNQTITLWTRKRRGGNHEPRVQGMPKALASLLWRRKKNPERHETLVFPTRNGTMHKRSAWFLREFFARVCKRAGIERFTAHGIRHHVATRLKDSKQATPYQIQHFLGHKNFRTTETYLHELDVDREVGDILTLEPVEEEKLS